MSIAPCDAEKEEGSKEGVGKEPTERIGDGIITLTYEVGEQHRRTISCHTSPGTRHKTITRHKKDVDTDEHHTSFCR